MKIRIPEKSIFGFKILNAKQSLYSAYFLILFTYTLNSQFGNSWEELIATYLFNVISNFSLIILLTNFILKTKGASILKKIIVFPLYLHIPISLVIIINSLFKLLSLLF